jgi:hypothetical protein
MHEKRAGRINSDLPSFLCNSQSYFSLDFFLLSKLLNAIQAKLRKDFLQNLPSINNSLISSEIVNAKVKKGFPQEGYLLLYRKR